MGTNYYALWNPPGAGRDSVTIKLHICKSLRSFSGLMFGSWQEWKKWLIYQSQDSRLGSGGHVEIEDEYGTPIPVEDFIRRVEATEPEERSRQHRWLLDHQDDSMMRLMIDDWKWDWVDADGFSFHRGEFF